MIWKREVTLDALNAMGEGNMVGLLDIRFERIGDDTLEATMPVDHRTKQPFGLLHGGASVVLAESIGSVAGYLCTQGSKRWWAGGECQPCTVGASGARTRRL
ncbi:ydiI hotdog fold superfamily [Salmonella enterica subsp. enterica]|nr:ydiI hotdog fold superfamily [Salmonella enterica subsp. enterica]